ncbi:MAG: hypothetical protein WD939_08920 [Dehalococcoidia bacterium]
MPSSTPTGTPPDVPTSTPTDTPPPGFTPTSGLTPLPGGNVSPGASPPAPPSPGAPTSDVLGLPPTGTGDTPPPGYLLLTVLLGLLAMLVSVLIVRPRPQPALAYVVTSGFAPGWRRTGGAPQPDPVAEAFVRARRFARLAFPPPSALPRMTRPPRKD